MSIEAIIKAFTENKVLCRIGNLKLAGLCEKTNRVIYEPEYRVTVGKDGRELFLSINDSLEAALKGAYDYAIKENLIKL